AARKVPPVARIVPTDLKDQSISEAPGTKLSYLGYEFEVPWSDLDKTQTKLYPNDKPAKYMVDLHFSSGLRLLFKACPPRQFTNSSDAVIKSAALATVSVFGLEAIRSDYSFTKAVYEFTPSKMHYWSLSPRVHYGEQGVLIIKSIMPVKAAETGIFNLQNQSYKGFQQGNPEVRQDGIIVDLFSDEGSVEMVFSQKSYKNSAGVTQPEINRIVESLRKTPQDDSATPCIAQK
ncbi:MAG: hypothetical protein WBE45_14035, partial [Terriglobales bacterium]